MKNSHCRVAYKFRNLFDDTTKETNMSFSCVNIITNTVNVSYLVLFQTFFNNPLILNAKYSVLIYSKLPPRKKTS